MANRVKYPLTDDAKEAAKMLVEAWNNDDIKQTIELLDTTAIGENGRSLTPVSGVSNREYILPTLGILRELSEYKLISVRDMTSLMGNGLRLEVTLLQELRNAVENDFAVSDYFLTVTAVGTIVQGDLEVKEGAIFQSAAATHDAIVTQNTGVIADTIENMLGTEILRDKQLQEAINALRGSDDEPRETRLKKMGNVIQELGRCLSHGANATVVIGAITYLSQFFNLL